MVNDKAPSLRRALSFPSLVVYGIGDILGAGIYALIGKAAGLAGYGCWLAFVAAFVVAWLTALSYAELGSRFPQSAGASVYSLRAFGNPLFSYFVGFLVLMSGGVSMATVSHAFSGYVQAIWPNVPLVWVILCFFLVLAGINFWGIRESSVANLVCTAIEISGILIIIVAGLKAFGRVDYLDVVPPTGKTFPTAFFQASVLAFYAFIGFEDMANVAEETEQPEKTVPRAIMVSLGVVAILYILTALAAVSLVTPKELASSSAPLLLAAERGFPGFPRELFVLIALFAVTNTALVNFIMASRLLYGMAREKLVPSFLGRVHPARQTPHLAIASVLILALVLAFTGKLIILAQSNSLILLIVFLLINLSLIKIKLGPSPSGNIFQIPLVVPVLGGLCCILLALFVDLRALTTVFFLILLAFGTYGFSKGIGTHSKGHASPPP